MPKVIPITYQILLPLFGGLSLVVAIHQRCITISPSIPAQTGGAFYAGQSASQDNAASYKFGAVILSFVPKSGMPVLSLRLLYGVPLRVLSSRLRFVSTKLLSKQLRHIASAAVVAVVALEFSQMLLGRLTTAQ